MKVLALDPDLLVVLVKILRHTLGERRHQGPVARLDILTDLLGKIGNLPHRGPNLHQGIQQTGWTIDELHHLSPAKLELVIGGGGRDKENLPRLLLPFIKPHRPVIESGGKPEAMLDQRLLPGSITVVHAANLWNGHVRLIEDGKKIIGEIIKQVVRPLPRGQTRKMTRIVFYPRTIADLHQQLTVIPGTRAEPLSLEQFSV